MSELKFDILHEEAGDFADIERLNDRAFGPGRYARTAYRLREGVPHDPRLSFVARVSTLLAGSIRLTPAKVGDVPILLLGPLVVDPVFEGKGIGQALISHVHDVARTLGHTFILLVGDAPYYEKSGYLRMSHGRVVFPGPVDPARVLYFELEQGALEGVRGMLRRDDDWALTQRQKQSEICA